MFKVILDLDQPSQKIKVLFVMLVSENKQIILKEAFKAIGTCIKAINIRINAISDGFLLSESLFLEVNLFREV